MSHNKLVGTNICDPIFIPVQFLTPYKGAHYV